MTTIQKVLVISSGIAVFNYNTQINDLQVSDEQLLSGFLGAFQSFSNDLGSEINSVKFKQVSIFYRIIKPSDARTDDVSIVFIADQSADEKDIRIRMEYACQIFVHKYMQYLVNNIINDDLFKSFQTELDIILNSERDKIESLLPKSFLQLLIKELQGSVPVKQLDKMLKKYDFVYDQQSKTLIVPGDLSTDTVEKIVTQLEQTTKMLFGKGIWDQCFANASKSVSNKY